MVRSDILRFLDVTSLKINRMGANSGHRGHCIPNGSRVSNGSCFQSASQEDTVRIHILGCLCNPAKTACDRVLQR